MVYHFFSKWKKIKSDVFTIDDEINQAERFYKLKIRFWKKIWDKLDKEEVDFAHSKRLLKLYENKLYSNLYRVMLDKIKDIEEIGLLKGEIDQFYELVFLLYKKTEEENELAKSILNELLSYKIPHKSKFNKIRDLLNIESTYLNIEDKEFNKIEQVFLIKRKPGAVIGGYIHIFKAVIKGVIYVKGNKLLFDGKPIQGLKIVHNKIRIKGDHYATMENVRWIEGEAYVEPSISDPYSYFVERGKLHSWSVQKIRKALGAKSAEAVVSLEIEIFPEQLYMKVKRNAPVKFAICNLKPNQVKNVIREAELVAA